MTIELTLKEQQVLKDLIKTELGETKVLINKLCKAEKDTKDLSNYYDILYMINQKLLKE